MGDGRSPGDRRLALSRPCAQIASPWGMEGGADHAVLTAAALRVPGIGAGRLRALHDAYGTLAAAVAAAERHGTPPPSFSKERFQRLPAALDLTGAARTVGEARRAGLEVLCWDDARYPAPLWHSGEAPPPLLYMRGTLPDALRAPAYRVRAAAVVGTRRATAKGLSLARELARALAEMRVVVVSGLALGIDGAAHQGALEGAGPTVAVLGGGLGHVHPPSHRPLARQILQAGGAILSEHPPDVLPEPHFFPRRNRIISGLSRLVVIVEAGLRSGTNATAAFANEQHRDVFACPGRPGDPSVAGALRLIRDGAHPLTELEDVLCHFRPAPGGTDPSTMVGASRVPEAAVGRSEAVVVDALSELEEATLDELAAALALRIGGASWRVPGVAELTARLTRLELRGAVVRTPSGRYRLAARVREGGAAGGGRAGGASERER